jgi:hypothetical protein
VSLTNLGISDRNSLILETFIYASLWNKLPIPSLHAV